MFTPRDPEQTKKLFEKYNIKTTWFIPGHSLETFPEECAMIRDAGHEIGLHGYSHENPRDMTIEQQEIVLDKTYKMITEFCGKVGERPVGGTRRRVDGRGHYKLTRACPT